MRKRYRVLLLAAIVAALVVPVGFALSLDTDLSAPSSSHRRVAAPAAHTVVAASARPAVHAAASPVASILSPVPEGAKLFFVGTVLFALAAAVRRTL